MQDQTDGVEVCGRFVTPADFSGSQSFHQSKREFLTYPLKRSIDILISLIALPIVLPIFGVLLVISGPSFIFSQKRVGVGGRHFRCFKLRTMIPNAEEVLAKIYEANPDIAREWEINQKLENDPRITRLGRFLRTTSLDELPQIFNVLFGDMSFVGPRPFMISQEETYRTAGGREYYKMKPGITGLWQTEGRGGTSFIARIAYDNQYAQMIGIRTDFILLVRTVSVVINRSGR